PDTVRLTGVRGHPRPSTLKALLYYDGGWLGEAEISYAGPNAEARARLGMDIDIPVRFDLIGSVSIFGDDDGRLLETHPLPHPHELRDVRLRAAVRHRDLAVIEQLHHEVTTIWIAGPAGGGGVRVHKRQRLFNTACFIPRELITE